jgi:hypothetical protein
MALLVSLTARSLFHAYTTAVLFLVAGRVIEIDVWLFVIAVFFVATLAEIREHKIKNHNYPNDHFSAVRDTVLVVILCLFIFLLRLLSFKIGKDIVLALLVGSILLSYFYIFLLDKSFEPKKSRHWEVKHYIDVIANASGPLILAPLLSQLLF